jgi:hypothetical protein
MRALRWWSLLLVPGGFVAGHELGYQGATALGSAPTASGGHGYLGLVVLVGVPFAVAALARSFLAGLRDQLPPVRYRTLALAQVALFLAVELAEHAAGGLGPGPTLVQPAVLLGLAAQFVVAAVVTLIVRTTRDAGAAVASTTRRPVLVARLRWYPAPDHPLAVAVWAASVPTRGPPAPPGITTTGIFA